VANQGLFALYHQLYDSAKTKFILVEWFYLMFYRLVEMESFHLIINLICLLLLRGTLLKLLHILWPIFIFLWCWFQTNSLTQFKLRNLKLGII
jgi:hypothetical protein